jgi:Ser/Thr protein kinase RdoA (MazF antagonist)
MTGMAAGHLVHGMGTTLEAPTWPVITDQEAEEILAYFPDAGEVQALRWHSPRPFSSATLVQTDRDEFILKRHSARLRSPAALAEEHAFMAHLRAAGLQIPDVMTTRDGMGSIAFDEWIYELHRKAPGTDLYRDRTSWTGFLTDDHAFAAGAALARLHLAAKGYAAAPRKPAPLIATFTILPAKDPLMATQAYAEQRPALARFLAGKPWQRDLARLFAAFGDGLSERLAQQPTLWTHNDWHPSNLLWSGDHVSTVFDFGLAAPTCAVHDIATAIERTAISWLDLDQGSCAQLGDAQAAGRLIAGYRSVLPLSSHDVETIVRMLPLVHLEFALSEVHYFAGILDDRRQADMAWQDYAIDHADWFLTASGRTFLQQLDHELAFP